MTFSPDGSRLLSCGNDFAARIWDVESGRQLLTLSNHNDIVLGVAWSRDGARIATLCGDGAVRVWSAERSRTTPAIDSWQLLAAPSLAGLDLQTFLNVDDGDWRIEEDKLVGKQSEQPDHSFSIAQALLRTIDLPRTVDIQFEASVSKPMLVAVILTNPARSLHYASFVSGVEQPFGKGSRLLIHSEKSTQQFALPGSARLFDLEAHRSHRFRLLREDGRLRLYVDDRELLDEAIPELDFPRLKLQGSWSAAGASNASNRERPPGAIERCILGEQRHGSSRLTQSL